MSFDGGREKTGCIREISPGPPHEPLSWLKSPHYVKQRTNMLLGLSRRGAAYWVHWKRTVSEGTTMLPVTVNWPFSRC